MTTSRRDFFFTASSLLVAACSRSNLVVSAPSPSPSIPPPTIPEIERRVGGRVGVFALDTGSGRTVAHRADERFAMCSTFKWVLAAAVLSRVDRAELSLEEHVAYQFSDVLEYAPVARQHVAEGFMSVDALARATVTVSDNTTANLLLRKIGGPAGLTRFVRTLGDDVTRLDRDEPTLNTNEPGDPRDTTSPHAMVTLLRRILCDADVLSPASRARLSGSMVDCETGKARLRAGLPTNWKVGDKTGTGQRNAVNDVAFATPPGRPPILIAVYMSEGVAPLEDLQAAHADVGRLVTRAFAVG